MNGLGEFTDEQIKLAKQIATRIKKLHKSGCAIVAKQDYLVAYISEEYENSTCDYNTGYPLQSLDLGRISDSGADDMDFLLSEYVERKEEK